MQPLRMFQVKAGCKIQFARASFAYNGQSCHLKRIALCVAVDGFKSDTFGLYHEFDDKQHQQVFPTIALFPSRNAGHGTMEKPGHNRRLADLSFVAGMLSTLAGGFSQRWQQCSLKYLSLNDWECSIDEGAAALIGEPDEKLRALGIHQRFLNCLRCGSDRIETPHNDTPANHNSAVTCLNCGRETPAALWNTRDNQNEAVVTKAS